jgi:hypothetical protein
MSTALIPHMTRSSYEFEDFSFLELRSFLWVATDLRFGEIYFLHILPSR